MPASLTIAPAGQTLTVNVYLANGSTAATCYTTADLSSSVTFPAAVTFRLGQVTVRNLTTAGIVTV